MTSCNTQGQACNPDIFEAQYLDNSTNCSNGTDTSFRRTYSCYAQSPLETFPCCFPVDEEVANLLRTCYAEATGKRLDFGLYWQK